MQHSISSSELTVAVKTQGAELCSIQDTQETEYIWQADRTIWAQHAPILFPIVGKLADNRYTYGGDGYEMAQHGFARHMEFTTVEQSDNALTLELQASDITRSQYPFEFVLRVYYTLNGTTVTIRYEVHNPDRCTMPFSIGAHPGFALSWGEDDHIEDYYIELEQAESLVTHKLNKNKLLSTRTVPVLSNSNRIQLTDHLFDEDALIFMDHKSRKAALCSHKNNRRIVVAFPEFPHLGIWAKPGAPFVCIEPWFGHVDPVGTDGNIMRKTGIILLAEHATFCCRHQISLEGAR